MPRAITPNLWFDTQAEEAAEYYCSIFPDSRVVNVTHYTEAAPGKAGQVLTVDFELQGQRFTALNGGPEFNFTEAVSFQIDCADQEEADHYWYSLSKDGEESQCGWLKDRYGLSWQVVPRRLLELLADPDAGRSTRAMQAMLRMGRIDVAELERAADGG